MTLLLMHLIVRHRIPLQSAFRYVRSCRYCSTLLSPNITCDIAFCFVFKLYVCHIHVDCLCVHHGRPQINPNDSFKLQLARLEVQELRYSSVAKDADKAWDFYDWNRYCTYLLCVLQYFSVQNVQT